MSVSKDIITIVYVFNRMGMGGAEVMIMNVLRRLPPSRFRCYFVVHIPEKQVFDDEIKSLGGTIIVCPRLEQVGVVRYKKWWQNFFSSNSVDIVHGNYRRTSALYLHEAKKAGVSTILHTHSASSHSKLKIARRLYSKWILQNVDCIFSCSNKATEWLFGDPSSIKRRVVVIPNGIDTAQYRYDENVRRLYRQELQIENKTVVGHVGRFVPVKNHSFLLNVFKQYLVIDPNAVLLLIGDGPLKNEIENTISSENLTDSVKLLGIRRDVPALMQCLDIFLLPSLYEGLPVSLVEAQAASLPCVYSDTITAEAEISSTCYQYSLNKSPAEWAQYIKKILDNSIQRVAEDYTNSMFDVNNSLSIIEKEYEALVSD